MPLPELLILLFAFTISVVVPKSFAPLSTSAVFVPLPRLLALPSASIMSVAVSGLSAYIFKFFYYKSQSKSQSRPFTLSKEPINVVSCPFSQLLLLNYPLHHPLYPLPL